MSKDTHNGRCLMQCNSTAMNAFFNLRLPENSSNYGEYHGGEGVK
jgi:hypothetical protein